ncbi:MAG: pseudouridine-5'-phosphate glycosidase [Rhodobiaceae bacterium]|nr:pseudouridine-5'-phosphate glycosidase [Rhodobiaceae bacterium]
MSVPALVVSPAVSDALAAGRPVVALESTIITHGMPFPDNLSTARAVEAVVRENGAEPATIAILDGKPTVGVAGSDLQRLARAGHAASKASRRDMAALAVTGATAGTTVATTMQIAAMAGIRVFATGGIGGVHRGAAESFDVSADLAEFARTPVAVVCAGAKSILDIAATLEVLETNGVPVVGFGTDDFPAFFARSSGLKVGYRFDTAGEIAAVCAAHFALPGSGGVLVANPVPEADALDEAEIGTIIDGALADAAKVGVRGKDVTPFLLQRIVERTGGRSLAANIALVKNNAALAARIAVEMAALRA